MTRRTVQGQWKRCYVCEEMRWVDPKLEMCGVCTFGSFEDIDAFKGEYEMGDPEDFEEEEDA